MQKEFKRTEPHKKGCPTSDSSARMTPFSLFRLFPLS